MASLVPPAMNTGWSASDDEDEEAYLRQRTGSRGRTARGFGYLLVVGLLLGAGWLLGRSSSEAPPQRFLPGEFERHDGLLIAWLPQTTANSREQTAHRQVLAKIVSAVRSRVELVVMTADEATRRDFLAFLEQSLPEPVHYRTVSAPATVTWCRDYGPLVTKKLDGGFEAVKMLYVDQHHPRTANIPEIISGPLGLPLVAPQLYLEGGNLLSNGCGVCVTTEFLIEKNKKRLGLSRVEVSGLLRDYLGAREVVILKSLVDEPNSHVDMFATFTAPDAIVVGQYDRDYDPTNARILDENAKKLASVTTACGPLRVYRVPMPERPDGYWRTYTNVAYVNGVLLFPTYGAAHRGTEEAAVAVFQKLLPGWIIERIDCSEVIDGNGALHCLTMNICRLGEPLAGRDAP